MAAQDDSPTHASLIHRLATDVSDETAWTEFVARYAPRIYEWAKGMSVQDADAEDVTAAVLLRLSARMKTFVYDPSKSFRGWLRTITRNAAADLLSMERRWMTVEFRELEEIEARDDLVRRLEREYDVELVEEAGRRVRRTIAPSTWEAYRLTAIEGLSGAETASRLGMKVGNVFVAKSTVLAKIREEVRRLD